MWNRRKVVYIFFSSCIVLFACIVVIAFLLGRVNKIKEENIKLKWKIAELREENDRLNSIISKIQQTDDYYYQMGVSSRQEKKYEESNWYFEEMIKRFPKSQLINEARTIIKRNNDDIAKIAKNIEQEQEAALKRRCDLELITWSWSTTGSGSYVKASGQVKNISDQSLRNVEAVVSFYDKNGNFITSSSALIDYNPILTGQTSPFSVIETYNPAMEKASVEFKFLMGGTIPTYRRKKK